jgi:hypothetical protein
LQTGPLERSALAPPMLTYFSKAPLHPLSPLPPMCNGNFGTSCNTNFGTMPGCLPHSDRLEARPTTVGSDLGALFNLSPAAEPARRPRASARVEEAVEAARCATSRTRRSRWRIQRRKAPREASTGEMKRLRGASRGQAWSAGPVRITPRRECRFSQRPRSRDR